MSSNSSETTELYDKPKLSMKPKVNNVKENQTSKITKQPQSKIYDYRPTPITNKTIIRDQNSNSQINPKSLSEYDSAVQNVKVHARVRECVQRQPSWRAPCTLLVVVLAVALALGVLRTFVFYPSDVIPAATDAPFDRHGFTQLRERLDAHTVESFRAFFHDDGTVAYDAVERDLLPLLKDAVDRQMGWNVRFNTYRCSDCTNLLGASGFHRDDYNFTTFQRIVPSFTVLLYLDAAEFEYIPGTHLMRSMNPVRAFQMMRKHVVHTRMQAGTVAVMYGTLVHRGASSARCTDHRRLVQCFVTMPSPEASATWEPHITIKWGNGARRESQGQWIRPILPFLNVFYAYQQMCRFQVPGLQNYIPHQMRRNKLAVPFSMPVRRRPTDTAQNLAVMVPGCTIPHFEP